MWIRFEAIFLIILSVYSVNLTLLTIFNAALAIHLVALATLPEAFDSVNSVYLAICTCKLQVFVLVLFSIY